MANYTRQSKPISESLITVFATVAPSLWATSFLVVKYVVQTIPPFTAAAFRFFVVVIILWALVVVLKVRGPRHPTLRDVPLVAATGLAQTTFYFAFQYWGLRLTSAANGAVLGNTRPIFVALIAMLFLHEVLSRRKALGIALAFVGVMFIIGLDSLPIAGSGTGQFIGDLALLLSAVSGAVGLVLTKRVVARFGPLPSLAYTNTFGALGLLLLAVLELSTRTTPIPATTITPWLALVYQAVFTTVLAHILWNTVLSRRDASWAAVFLYITPVVTALLSWLILGEQPTWNLVVGASLVFLGTYVVTRRNEPTDPG